MPYKSNSNITRDKIMKVYLTKPPRTQTCNKWTSVLGFGLESQFKKSFKSYGSFSDIALGWKEK